MTADHSQRLAKLYPLCSTVSPRATACSCLQQVASSDKSDPFLGTGRLFDPVMLQERNMSLLTYLKPWRQFRPFFSLSNFPLISLLWCGGYPTSPQLY